MYSRYTAQECVVYDNEEGEVAEYCTNQYEAARSAAIRNKSEQDRAAIAEMMRQNRASGF